MRCCAIGSRRDLLHSHDVRHGLIFIHTVHLLYHRVGHGPRQHRRSRAYQQVLRAEDPWELLIRDIDLRMKATVGSLA